MKKEILAGENIIYFGPGKWDGLWRCRHHLMAGLSKQNKVLYVEPRLGGIRATLDSLRQGHLKGGDFFCSFVRPINENLHIFQYPILTPATQNYFLKDIMRKFSRKLLLSALSKLNLSNPIVWFSQPSMVEILSDISNASPLIYHVFDEYSEYQGVRLDDQATVLQIEKKMMAQVDMVIVTSKMLYSTKSPYNQNTFLVSHGVNHEAYLQALDDPDRPDDLQKITPPRLGYCGLIGDKLDFHMLKDLAHDNPQWSLVFLGEVRVLDQVNVWKELLNLPNVHYLGQVSVEQLPQYVSAFQVGILPYANNRLTSFRNPLKLYEFFAAGIPVATVDIPELDEFKPYIYSAKHSKDFSLAVEAALSDTTPDRVRSRMKVAAECSWSRRVEEISELIRKWRQEKFQNQTDD